MAALVWVRHGVTEENQQKRYIGHYDAALSSAGHEQAKLLGIKLQDSRIDAIYTSDLLRARQTAAHIAAFHPLVPLISLPDLRELSFGEWEAKTYEQIEEADRDAIYRFYDNPWTCAPTGGETLADMKARLDLFLQLVLQQHRADETVVVVSHAGMIKLFSAVYIDHDPSRFFHYHVSHGQTLVCSFNDIGRRWQTCESQI